MNFLLDIVSDNGTPDYEVTLSDSFQNIMEECGETIIFALFLGIFIGIAISRLCFVIHRYFKRKASSEELIKDEIKSEENKLPIVETNVKNNTEDKFETKFIIGFILVIVLICVIAVGVAISNSNKTDDQNETPVAETRDATNKDIIINVNNMTLSIQASEKIEGLVVKVKYLDKDKNILKTENVNVGNIAPGNTFQHTLTKTGMQVPDLDKLKSVTVDVIDGTIEE